jgi:cell wall-associated NlpC family hydrolase
MTPTAIINKYITVKYRRNGRNPKIGLDCWGMVMCVIYDIHNIELPDPNYQLRTLVKENHSIFETYDISKWVTKTENLIYGDIILFYSIKDLPIHVGVYLGKQRFIHSIMPYGARIEELERYKTKVAGYYRLRKNDD